MAQGAIDRRAARTRDRLQRAHLALILKKGFEQTTVEEICEAAEVGRSTFYGHFADKTDLKRSGFDELRRSLRALYHDAPRGCPPPLRFSLPLLEHAREHLELFHALQRDSGVGIALDEVRSLLTELVGLELAHAQPPAAAATAPRALLVEQVVGGFLAMLAWWLNRGADIPAAEIDASFRATVQPAWSDRPSPPVR